MITNAENPTNVTEMVASAKRCADAENAIVPPPATAYFSTALKSTYSSLRRTQNGPRPFSSRPFGTMSR